MQAITLRQRRSTGILDDLREISRLELGIPFRLLNPITTKQYIRATVRKKKTDTSDAEIIARNALRGEGTLLTSDSLSVAQPITRTSVKLTQMSTMLKLVQHHNREVLPPSLHEELQACERRLEESVRVFLKEAATHVPHEVSQLLQSIPGIGPITATMIVAEVGDISRFPNASALVSYIGLDPKVSQSGVSLNRNSRLTKRGSPYLRRTLYLAACQAQRWDKDLRAVYARKRAEGKRHTGATIVTARKLVHRVYAVWKRGTAYEPAEIPATPLPTEP